MSYYLRGIAIVGILNAIVLYGIIGSKMYDLAITQMGDGEDHNAESVALGGVGDGVAETYQMTASMVYRPLEGIAVKLLVVKQDALYRFSFAVKRDAFHIADIFFSIDHFLVGLRDIDQGERVVLVELLHTKGCDIGMIGVGKTAQLEGRCLLFQGGKLIQGGETLVLNAQQPVVVDTHSLITLLLVALQGGDILQLEL